MSVFQILGAVMVLAVFAAIFGGTVMAAGLRHAVLIWLVAIGLAAFLICGLSLLVGHI